MSAETSQRTLRHYAAHAAEFWQGTRDHDVSQNIDAMLSAIHTSPPFRLLDFGCGPGRDLAELRRRGHDPIGLDGCAEFVVMAQQNSGCEVWHQDFLELALPPARFDGVFANA